MKMSTCTTPLYSVFGLLLLVFLLAFVVTFTENYTLGQEVKRGHEKMAKFCETHADARELEPDMCQRRTVAAKMSPRTFALKQVFMKTGNICDAVVISLGNGFGAILDRSGWALFNITLGMGIFLIFFAVLMRVVGPLVKTSADSGNFYSNSLEHGGPPLRVLNDSYDTQYQPSNIHLLPRKRLQTSADISD